MLLQYLRKCTNVRHTPRVGHVHNRKKKKRTEEEDKLIQWAGGLHQRNDFNKRRDNLGQWTEVLFKH